jgi:hypothetical protein
MPELASPKDIEEVMTAVNELVVSGRQDVDTGGAL